MNSKPKIEPFVRFQETLNSVLKVSKGRMKELLAEEEQKKGKKKRGPKPSSSGHAVS